jgi:prepilin-type N-terminal cleavage/methylation domain-containing protein
MARKRKSTRRSGFTLIEILVVVLILGILASFAVPQYFKVVEKGKAAEAFTTFGDVHGAQDRYLAGTGQYCIGLPAVCPSFDLALPNLKYFNPPPAFVIGTSAPSYKLVLTRNTTPGLYGAYSITYDVEPGAPPTITCSQANCQLDLLPE